MDDFYKILNISKTATPLEIKESYRKLAIQYHPDKNRGNHLAERKFKQISEAYSILSHPEKRQSYDNSQKLFQQNVIHERGSSYTPPTPKKEAMPEMLDAFITMKLTLEEAHQGCLKKIVFDRKQNSKIQTAQLSINIPQGVRKGKVLRLAGEGHRSHSKKGDLHIKIKIKRHSLFHVQGHDLIMELPLSITDAILGRKMTIPTLTKTVNIEIKPGVYAGQQLKLKGQGLYCDDLSSRGDLILEIKIDIPNQITEEEKQWFKHFRKTEQLPHSVAQFNIQYRKLLIKRAS